MRLLVGIDLLLVKYRMRCFRSPRKFYHALVYQNCMYTSGRCVDNIDTVHFDVFPKESLVFYAVIDP